MAMRSQVQSVECVYFIQAPINELIKIGYTAQTLWGRLIQMESMSPVPLKPLGYVHAAGFPEKELHARFAEYRAHGEWFRPGAMLLHFIASHARRWPPRPKSRSQVRAELRAVVAAEALKKWAAVRYIEIGGTDRSVAEWSQRSGLSVGEIRRRVVGEANYLGLYDELERFA